MAVARQRANGRVVIGEVEYARPHHAHRGLGRQHVGPPQHQHAVADDGVAHVRADPGQHGRAAAIPDQIDHVGAHAVVGDDDGARPAKVEVVRGVGAVDAAGQRQGGIAFRLNAGRVVQRDGARPHVGILHVAQRAFVRHAHAGQSQRFGKVCRRARRPQFQRAAGVDRRPACVGAQRTPRTNAQRALVHRHVAGPVHVGF